MTTVQPLEENGGQASNPWKPYPAYKPSGVECLGQVPEHWGVDRLKWAVRGCQNGIWGDEPDGEDDIVCIRVADFDRTRFRVVDNPPTVRSITTSQRKGRLLRPDDLIIEKSGGGEKQLVGCVVSFEHSFPAVTSNFVARMPIATNMVSRFWVYVYASMYSGRLNYPSIKQTTGIQNLDSDAYLCERFVYPPADEQLAIATFLDRETGKIDRLVAKNRELIEKLKEERAALISRAVTRGLNPNAKRKPSGVEWLGDVPEHWEVVPVRRRSRRIQTGSTPPTAEERYYEDGTIPWFGPGSFDDQIVVTRPVKWLNASAVADGAARMFAAGATMVVAIGATLGKVSSFATPGSCNQQITVVEYDERRVFPRFATYQIKRLETTLRAIAPSATLPILDQGQIADIVLGVPPLPEQHAIADFLDRETGKIDRLAAKVDEAISRLQEYRAALITAAVTGKIDVRKVAA